MRPTFMKFPLLFRYVSLLSDTLLRTLSAHAPAQSFKYQVHGRPFIVPHIRRQVLRNELCVCCDLIPCVFPLGQ
jgi:hypothetical protein